jgi:hypothetical protein
VDAELAVILSREDAERSKTQVAVESVRGSGTRRDHAATRSMRAV